MLCPSSRGMIIASLVAIFILICELPTSLSSQHCSDGDIRLIRQTSKNKRSTFNDHSKDAIDNQLNIVKVCVNDGWWYVEGNTLWNRTCASIACSTLNNSYKDSTYGTVTLPTPSLQTIANIKCRGDELDLSECVIKAKPINSTRVTPPDGGSGNGSGDDDLEDDRATSVDQDEFSVHAHGRMGHDWDTRFDNVDDTDGSGSLSNSGSRSRPSLNAEDNFSVGGRSQDGATANEGHGGTIKVATLMCQGTVVPNYTLAALPPPPKCKENSIELMPFDSASSLAGVVRVCYNGSWSVLCTHKSKWSDTEARVVCTQLGYSMQGALAIDRAKKLPPNTSKNSVLDSHIRCTNRNPRNLSDCNKYSSLKTLMEGNCPSNRHLAGVQCQEHCIEGAIKYSTSLTHSDVHIVTINVCKDKLWRPICDEDWTYQDASVLCKGTGYSRYGALPIQFTSSEAINNKLTAAYGATLSLSINCTGDELHPSYCRNVSSTCPNGGVSTAVCLVDGYDRKECETGTVRLLNALSMKGSGELQICVNNLWGGVGYPLLDRTAGRVICRDLGFNGTEAKIWKSDMGKYSPLFSPKITCNGNEQLLRDCLQPSQTFSRFFGGIKDENYGSTHLECVPPIKITSLTPLHQVIFLSRQKTRQINYTCTVSGKLPITVNWYYYPYHGSTAKEPLDEITDYESVVMMTQGISLKDAIAANREIISTEVLKDSHQSTLSIGDLSPSKNGHYLCIASNAIGQDEAHGFLFVSVKPTISLSFNPPVAMLGELVNVTCSVTSNLELSSLTLMKGGHPIPPSYCLMSNKTNAGADTYSYQLEYHIEHAVYNDEEVYSCEAFEKGNKSSGRSDKYLQVQSFPVMSSPPLNQNVTINITNKGSLLFSMVNLSCSVSGNPRPIVQWYRLDSTTTCDALSEPAIQQLVLITRENIDYSITNIVNSSNTYHSLLTINALSSYASGTYICLGTNSLGSVRQSVNISVKKEYVGAVQFSLSAVSRDPLEPPIIAGDSICLVCTTTSTIVTSLTDAFEVNWLKNGVTFAHRVHTKDTITANSWNATLIMDNVNTNDNGRYSCRVGTTQVYVSNMVQLKVEEPLVVRLFNNSPQVSEDHMTSFINVNKPGASLVCTITDKYNTTINCSSGVAHFADLWCMGPRRIINFTVKASTNREVAIMERQFYPGFNYCAVNLINSGVTITGRNVTVEFTGLGGYSGFICHLNGTALRCSSPWTISIPRPGIHHLRIKPMACHGNKIAFKQSITVD